MSTSNSNWLIPSVFLKKPITVQLFNKAIPSQAWTGPWSSGSFESHSISRQSAHEGGKVVSPTHRQLLPLAPSQGNINGAHFCLRMSGAIPRMPHLYGTRRKKREQSVTTTYAKHYRMLQRNMFRPLQKVVIRHFKTNKESLQTAH